MLAILPSPTAEPRAEGPRLGARVLLLSTLFIFLGAFWGVHSSLITHAGNIAVAVPPIPAVATLALLLAVGPVLRRVTPALVPSPSEMLLLYAMTCVGVQMCSVGVIRHLMPALTVAGYFAEPGNGLAELRSHVPAWALPQGAETIRGMYEGLEGGSIPWVDWAGPLAFWSLFMLVINVTTLGAAWVMRPQWTHREKLTYPLVDLALRVTTSAPGTGQPRLLRDPIMWIGFGVAAIHNILNIVHAFNPQSPCLGNVLELGALFTERPISGLAPLTFYHRPELIGLGYLVPVDMGLTVWVSHLLLRIIRVAALMAGNDNPALPYPEEQSVGAYVALAAILVFMARGHLRSLLGSALWGGWRADRLAVIAVTGGFAATVAMAMALGIRFGWALLFLAMIYAIAFVHARIRAEAGTPVMSVFPWKRHDVFIASLGGRLLGGAAPANLAGLSMLGWLGRGHFPELMSFQLEDLEMAERAGIRLRRMTSGLVVALLLGMIAAYWWHLHAYYSYGANVLEGGTTEGGYRVRVQREILAGAARQLLSPTSPDWTLCRAIGVGAVVVTVMHALRAWLLRFPLSPLGYAMTAAYGYLLWGPFLVASVAKIITLKLGGARLYRRIEPAFLGLALGQFMTAGVLWGLLATAGPDMWRYYHVTFD